MGKLKQRLQTVLGAFLGRPRRNLGFQEAARRKPKRPPNDVGRRLEEDTAEYRLLQHILAKIAFCDVGGALEITLGT